MPRMLFIGGSIRAREVYVAPVGNEDGGVRMPAKHSLPAELAPICARLDRNGCPPAPGFSQGYTLKHIGTNRGIDMVYVNDELTEKEAMDIYNEYVGAKYNASNT